MSIGIIPMFSEMRDELTSRAENKDFFPENPIEFVYSKDLLLKKPD